MRRSRTNSNPLALLVVNAYRLRMAKCRNDCGSEIFFAWDEKFTRWVPIDIELIRGDETEFEGGVLREAHHMRHRCGFHSRRPNEAIPELAERIKAFEALYLLPTAPAEVIRAVYRALAQVHHPDVGGSATRMAALNRAYELLMEESG